ncbi:unnamed protein product [Arctia plantaginis]|nr:unnamed protein product [Arctia plantaginis]
MSASPHSNIKTRTADFAEDLKAEKNDEEEDVNSPDPPTVKNSQDYLASGKSNAKTKTGNFLDERGKSDLNDNDHSLNLITKDFKMHSDIRNPKGKEKRKDYSARLLYSNEKDYAVYEIGSPDLWHTVHIQLFEKLSTPDGKTVWNDLTKGEVASVGSMTPEWIGQDLNVKYRSTKWIPREDFELPSTARLCLLVPINDRHVDSYTDNSSSYSTYEDSDYIVVPQEDILRTNEDTKLTENNQDSENAVNSIEFVEQNHPRITIRASRAVLKGGEEKLSIASHGSEKYLTLNHHQPLRAQIDVEARADENQLVRIGASGRISIAVSDNTRKTRSTLNLQVGNTGLAAARFRVTARDCYPLLTDLTKSKESITAGPILIPPRHTRSLRLEIPVEMPADDAHCSVSLINDEGQSVAVRDVTIRKGDRCFCVWHCDCVCLGMDPKLMCRDMDEARQKAAGLSTRDRMRHTRSVCYQDDVPLNIFTVFTGVIFVLLAMGL